MGIEISREMVPPQQEHRQEPKITVLRQKFSSRGADFVVETNNHAYLNNYAVMFRVGPLGLDIRADEAEALGQALIAAAAHYCRATGQENNAKLTGRGQE